MGFPHYFFHLSVTFSFEAGRRCASGEGNFEFDTRQGNEIFQAIEAAIEVQRGRAEPELARTPGRTQPHEEPKGPSGEGKGLKAKPAIPPGAVDPSGSPRGVDFPYAEPRDSLRRAGPEGAKAESEYAVPFDAVAKSFLARQFGGLGCPQEGLPEPLSVPRDGGGGQQPPGRPTAPKPEHIYDEPEGLSGGHQEVAGDTREVAGDVWKRRAREAPLEGSASPPERRCPGSRSPRPQTRSGPAPATLIPPGCASRGGRSRNGPGSSAGCASRGWRSLIPRDGEPRSGGGQCSFPGMDILNPPGWTVLISRNRHPESPRMQIPDHGVDDAHSQGWTSQIPQDGHPESPRMDIPDHEVDNAHSQGWTSRIP
uniref:IRS-type PTB domain-containing protein n=1 Tax=Cyanoderma ruficeps TaxID=181631 RepID=A0A8C3XFW5_9PASS